MLRLEGTDLEIEGDEGFKETVVEQQVYKVFLPAKDKTVLPPDEAEAVAEFEDEALKMGDEPVFELALLDGAADAKEFQIVPAFHHLVRLFREMLRQSEFEIVRLLFLHRPLISAGLDLIKQNVAGPSELCGGAEIVKSSGGVSEFVQYQQVVAPRNFCDKLSHKIDNFISMMRGWRVATAARLLYQEILQFSPGLGHLILRQLVAELETPYRAFISLTACERKRESVHSA